MNNTICPYTTNQLSADKFSREHIIPDALGGPNAFALRADALANSQHGAKVDSHLIHADFVAMLASKVGVKTRSGTSAWQLPGQLRADRSRVVAEFSGNSVRPRFTRPVETDPTTGRVIAVKGFGADARTSPNSAQLLRDHPRPREDRLPGDGLVSRRRIRRHKGGWNVPSVSACTAHPRRS